MHFLIGLVADAHGNSRAFDRAIGLLSEQGAQCFYFLGDAIGYIPSIAVLESLERLGGRVKCIRGNHEAMLLEGRGGIARDEVYQLEAVRKKLTPSQVRMISSWPVLRNEMIGDQRVLLVHGSPVDPTYGYVYPDTAISGFGLNVDWVFMSNTHHPFIREQAGTCYVNIGSCGMPRDDGRYGSAALFDSQARKARIIRFDITSESRQALQQFPSVHSSVRDVYGRRRSVVTGDVL